MREDEFRRWLRDTSGLQDAPQTNALSRCMRIEQHEGELDKHYALDRMAGLIARLTYSSMDEEKRAPAKHSIRILWNVRNGTASLKNAALLYRTFRDGSVPPVKNQESPISAPKQSVPYSPASTKRASTQWPEWNLPNKNEILQLARLTIPFIRFLNPDVVRAIVDNNESHRTSWSLGLQAKGIDPEIYIWDRCSCTFPGVRRYAGSTEIAQHRGRSSDGLIVDALRLDDNHFPKQLWSYILRGKPFQNVGPLGYALAHLTDHKVYKNRSATEFDSVSDDDVPPKPAYGLYTCATNMAYMPVTLIKPTDFAGPLRNLLQRRSEFLYGGFCNVVPPHLTVRAPESGAWSLDAFDWSEPVGSTEYVPQFLEFRQNKMNEFLT